MQTRPNLTDTLDDKTFLKFYYLKEELIQFCKNYDLQTTGSKVELTNRIAHFLKTGEKQKHTSTPHKSYSSPTSITLDTLIEENFVCSEKHRAFYKQEIGKQFSFNVVFQKWLKNNPGKTYQDSIQAYHQILKEKKENKSKIDSQFEYNTYIRDFFNDNPGKTLEQAIQCWKYKKSLPGTHSYDKLDLHILDL